MFAARVLADLGADVVRVEPPCGGRVRNLAPFLDDEPGTERGYYHLYHNANKRSVTLDIEADPGAEVLARLAAAADVLLETAPPGRMDSLGLGYANLSATNPGLVYVSVTPFGQTGPWKDRKANDLVAMAASGLLFIAGQPGEPPTQAVGHQAYKMASLAAACGAIIAITGWDKSIDRTGAHLDISLQEATSMAAVQTSNANHYTWQGNIPQRPGMTRGVYPTTDGGWVTLNAAADTFPRFLGWVRESGVDTDVTEDLAGGATGLTLLPEVLDLVKQVAALHTREGFLTKAWEIDQLTLPINTFDDLRDSEHIRVTRQFAPVWNDALDESFEFSRSPVDVFGRPTPINRAPLLGEHNADVFGEVGISAAELERLERSGVV